MDLRTLVSSLEYQICSFLTSKLNSPLEQFWLELSQGFVDLHMATFPYIPKFVEEMIKQMIYMPMIKDDFD